MATEDEDAGAAGVEPPSLEDEDEPGDVRVGEYTWEDFLADLGHDAAAAAYGREERTDGTASDDEAGAPADPWDGVDVDPEPYLGFEPATTGETVEMAASEATRLKEVFEAYCDPETTPVTKGEYTWEHFKREYYYEDGPAGRRPTDEDGETVPFEPADYLGFDPAALEDTLSLSADAADELLELEDERTVDVNPDLDEDTFFSTVAGHTTMTNRYDLEKEVDLEKKRHFREIERYWVNKPYSFVIVFHSRRENEQKYYLVEPYRTPIESDLKDFLTEKLRTAIKYSSDEVVVKGDEADRRGVIERETRKLLERYDLYEGDHSSVVDPLVDLLVSDGEEPPVLARIADLLEGHDLTRPVGEELRTRVEELVSDHVATETELDGLPARPEPALLAEDATDLTEYQVEKILYYLQRDFIGYERIDGIKHDINVEDVSCDGYDSPVFVYHTDYENLITNVYHGREELDDFVVKLAQRSGKGISKRQPQVDATLPDGSRAQLTLGREVSDHGTNYTIRQFKDVPFTPIDLVNWGTFGLDEMAFLWLCIENNKSLMFAGGTASGKTTSLNACSLFIPSNSKIVSIEDTREVELPQRNWIASVTRPSFGEDEKGDIDEFDLLEAALRQRPDYIVMGEVRGEEGRTLFQIMSTGHTTYTTFHADNVSEVIKRFTTAPIDVSKTLFTALDLISIQSQTRMAGKKVRRSRNITEINRYDAENDEINVNDVFQWEPESDEYRHTADSNTLQDIKFDRGWSQADLERELFERRVILAYLIENGLNEYAQVAATIQAFLNDSETLLTLVANDELESSLEALRGMETVLIDIEPEKEELVPRPDPSEEVRAEAQSLLERAEDELFEEYRGESASDITDLFQSSPATDVVVDEPYEADDEGELVDATEAADDEGESVDETETGDDEAEPSGETETGDDEAEPSGEAETGDDEAESSEEAEAADDGAESQGGGEE